MRTRHTRRGKERREKNGPVKIAPVLGHPGYRRAIDGKTRGCHLVAKAPRQGNRLVSRVEHVPGGKSSPIRGQPVLLTVVRNARDDDIVSALEKQPSELGKLRAAIRQAVHEYEDTFRWMTMLQKLNRAFRADIRGRARDQGLDFSYRFIVWPWFGGRLKDKRLVVHGQAKNWQQYSRSQCGTDQQYSPGGPPSLSLAHSFVEGTHRA
jgi:hypothetical protein